jgi:plastocyanin
MTTRTVPLSLALLLALGTVPALADEDIADHAKHDTHTVTLDGNDVRPSTTTMSHGDVIAFANYSTHPVTVTFTDPPDLKSKIRCGLVKSTAPAPSDPWATFSWQDGKLVGNVPPGRFASVCALDPGSYSFTAEILGTQTRSPSQSGVLPAKGQIVVK